MVTSAMASNRGDAHGMARETAPVPHRVSCPAFVGRAEELDILEATGIYRSFAGGHIHMVDVLHRNAAGIFIEHCFCHISREHGKP